MQHLTKQHGSSSTMISANCLLENSRQVCWSALHPLGQGCLEKSGLPRKCKLWYPQFGFLPMVMWPLNIYKVAITDVEVMELKISGMFRKRLGVPQSLTSAALRGHSAKFMLPMTSLREESPRRSYTHPTLHVSTDPVISNVAPEVKSSRKWQAAAAVEDAISSLHWTRGDCWGNTSRATGPR